MTAPFERPTETVQALPEQKPDEFRAWTASRSRSNGGWLLLFVGWLGGSVALALDLEDTRHLLDRVAFGPTPARVAAQSRKVRSPHLMRRQHPLYRQHALGHYADRLRAVATDPALPSSWCAIRSGTSCSSACGRPALPR